MNCSLKMKGKRRRHKKVILTINMGRKCWDLNGKNIIYVRGFYSFLKFHFPIHGYIPILIGINTTIRYICMACVYIIQSHSKFCLTISSLHFCRCRSSNLQKISIRKKRLFFILLFGKEFPQTIDKWCEHFKWIYLEYFRIHFYHFTQYECLHFSSTHEQLFPSKLISLKCAVGKRIRK